jgi:hypothetical protein
LSYAAIRRLPDYRPASPRRRDNAPPPFANFIVLSLLLHALAVLLFGAPSGGSREGRAMWGALQVVLTGSAPELRLKLDRADADTERPLLDRVLRRPAPTAPAVSAPPAAPVPMPTPPVAPAPAAVTPAAPVPEPVKQEPAPRVETIPIPPLLDRIVTPDPQLEKLPPLRVPPPTETFEPKPLPPPETRLPEGARVAPVEAPAIPAPAPLPAPTLPAPAPKPATESSAIPALPVVPATPLVEKPPVESVAVPVPAAPRVEKAPAETIAVPLPVTPPVETTPVETPALPTPPVAQPPVAVPALPAPVKQSVPPQVERAPAMDRAPAIEKAPAIENAPAIEKAPATPSPTATPADRTAPQAPAVEPTRRPAGDSTLKIPPLPSTPNDSPFRAPPRGDFPRGRDDYDPTRSKDVDLDAMRRRAAQLGREGMGNRAALPFPMPPLPERKSKEAIAIENARKPDCKTAYQSLGLLAVVPLVANEFGEGNCRW